MLPIAMDQRQIDDLFLSVHAGGTGQQGWPVFVEKIRAVTRASYASLVFGPAGVDLADLRVIRSGSNGQAIDSQGSSALARKAGLPYHSLQPNCPYRLPDVIDGRSGDSLEYVDYLRQWQINYATVVRIGDHDGGSLWLTLCDSRSDFSPDVHELLARLAPHLSLATSSMAKIERERTRADIAADALRRLNFGWLTFDERGFVTDIDETAQCLFRKIPALARIARGRQFQIGGKIGCELAGLLAEAGEGRLRKGRTIHLMDEPWLDMLVTPRRGRGAVGYVHGDRSPGPDRCEHLMRLFGLTSSEARLALALSQGRSIAQASEELGLTIETARNYSKRIYAKTGTRGQAELVRVILSGVIALT